MAEGKHEHVNAWESATSPDYNGRILVTEHCECGHVLRTYWDSVL